MQGPQAKHIPTPDQVLRLPLGAKFPVSNMLHSRAFWNRVLSLGLLMFGAVLGPAGCFVPSLTSTHQMPGHPSCHPFPSCEIHRALIHSFVLGVVLV